MGDALSWPLAGVARPSAGKRRLRALKAVAGTAPAAAESVAWEDAAVEHVVTQAAGYPYFLQQFGQDAWNDAAGPNITLTDARVGVANGRAALDTGFFRIRWDRATPTEQRYLRAMAEDGDAGSGSGDVAGRLDRKITSLGPTRANLIAKGLVYAPEHCNRLADSRSSRPELFANALPRPSVHADSFFLDRT